MLRAVCISVVLSAGLLPAVALAQQVGDKLVIIVDKAPLKSGNDTTGTVPKGALLLVKNVNGDWFWVTYSANKGTVKGWIYRSDFIPVSQALDFFNEELSRNPTSWAYVGRGMSSDEKGDHDSAINDFNEAIRLDPKLSDAFQGRGTAWEQKGDYDKAISDYNEAIRLDPKSARSYCGLGNVSATQGEYDKAVTNLNRAIQLDPKFADARNGRAWLAATCPDAKYRNGTQAVADAIKANELNGGHLPNDLDTLGAAYAEAGDFPNAVKWQEKAVELAPAAKRSDYQARLELYRARQPYRETVQR
jgi:tetratricopeptide (TPR) repeat protein